MLAELRSGLADYLATRSGSTYPAPWRTWSPSTASTRTPSSALRAGAVRAVPGGAGVDSAEYAAARARCVSAARDDGIDAVLREPTTSTPWSRPSYAPGLPDRPGQPGGPPGLVHQRRRRWPAIPLLTVPIGSGGRAARGGVVLGHRRQRGHADRDRARLRGGPRPRRRTRCRPRPSSRSSRPAQTGQPPPSCRAVTDLTRPAPLAVRGVDRVLRLPLSTSHAPRVRRNRSGQLSGRNAVPGPRRHVVVGAHRITGVALFFFLFAHVIDTAMVRVSPEVYNHGGGDLQEPGRRADGGRARRRRALPRPQRRPDHPGRLLGEGPALPAAELGTVLGVCASSSSYRSSSGTCARLRRLTRHMTPPTTPTSRPPTARAFRLGRGRRAAATSS